MQGNTGNLKAHEAMRLGAMMNPQTRGSLKASNGSTCALGAILDALSFDYFLSFIERGDDGYGYEALTARYHFMLSVVPHPCAGQLNFAENEKIKTIIPQLNDFQWTREAIANWLKPIEESLFIGPLLENGLTSTIRLTPELVGVLA